MTYKHNNKAGGFTLVEMMVAVALFSVIMVVSLGALLSLVDANKRAHGVQAVVNNLNVTLDGMVRALRMGSDYQVNGGKDVLSFTAHDGTDVEYRYVKVADAHGVLRGRIEKRYTPRGFNHQVSIYLTGQEVDITGLRFYVTGETAGDTLQPRVLIVMKGISGYESARTTTTFNIQATATQRLLDI